MVLTIDEAIRHCEEVAEKYESRLNSPYKAEDYELDDKFCKECAADHRQLAEWLMELKERREQPVEHSKWICVNEDENVYMCDKCGGEVIFIEGNPTNNEYIYCMYCGAKMDMSEPIKG